MTELRSQEELAGETPLPYVELRPKSPPLQITEAGPLPLPPPPPPFDRTAALAELQTAFAQLTDDEIQVARMRILGAPYTGISEELGMPDEEVEKQWKRARRKLGAALFGGGDSTTPDTTPPTSPGPESRKETPQETGGTSPA